MLNTKKLSKGYYRLEWNKQDIVGLWIEKCHSSWELQNMDGRVLYKAPTKGAIMEYAKDMIGY